MTKKWDPSHAIYMQKYKGITTIGTACILILILGSCRQKVKDNQDKKSEGVSLIKYAQGFDLLDFKTHKKLVIKSPFPKAEAQQEFLLFSEAAKSGNQKNQLQIPMQQLVATSTTHIPMLELLGEADKLVGFPNTSYITSPETVSRIERGLVADIGNAQQLNTELLISLRPEAIVAFSMGGGSDAFGTLEKTGIPVIYNGDWLEETPLGRAEWIKFFGALLDKDREADSIFRQIERQYAEAKSAASKAVKRPSVLSGVLFKDKWNLPAGESFTARLFEDANTRYLWADTEGRGSLVLSFESVYEKAKNADYWIGSGYYTRFEELGEANPHYGRFLSFEKRKVFTFSKKRGKNGGVIYFELAPVMPHIVLKDLIKTTHPDLLPGYEPYFLQRLD